jgi:hypothetical protein
VEDLLAFGEDDEAFLTRRVPQALIQAHEMMAGRMTIGPHKSRCELQRISGSEWMEKQRPRGVLAYSHARFDLCPFGSETRNDSASLIFSDSVNEPLSPLPRKR